MSSGKEIFKRSLAGAGISRVVRGEWARQRTVLRVLGCALLRYGNGCGGASDREEERSFLCSQIPGNRRLGVSCRAAQRSSRVGQDVGYARGWGDGRKERERQTLH